MNDTFNWNDYENNIGDDVGAAEKAAAAGLTKSNFGKLAVTNIRYSKFEEIGGAWTATDIDRAEYATRMADAKDRRGTMMEFTFEVNLAEFNPNLDFNYTRRVRVGSPDWRKNFVPSVEAVYGKGTMNADKRGATLKSLVGSYVEVHDVPQQPTKNDKHINAATGEPYRTIAIARVFETKADCLAAYVEKFGKPDAAALDSDTSNAVFEMAAELLGEGCSPEDVIAAIMNKFGLTRDQVRPLVQQLLE